ncbi:hypothetical protein FRB94_003776 [Tulasnella sp. JGI-2019a]|nr:hypothetical protein FRB94_003776 [Tulasnella sp. JGI-2019a]
MVTPILAVLLLALCDCTVNAQAVSVQFTVPASAVACGTLDFSWTTAVPTGMQTSELSTTNVTMWATDIGVDQSTPVSSSSTSVSASSAPASSSAGTPLALSSTSTSNTITTSSQAAAGVVTVSYSLPTIPAVRRSPHYARAANVNMTVTGPAPLLTTPGFHWSSVKLTPNAYYIISVRSVPNSPIVIEAHSSRFFVSAGSDQACLQTTTTTSATAKATHTAVAAVATSHKGISAGGIAGAVIGILALLALLTFLGILCLKRRRKVHKREGRFKARGQKASRSAGSTPRMEKEESQTTLAVNHNDRTSTNDPKYGAKDPEAQYEEGQRSLRYAQSAAERSNSFLQNMSNHSAPQTAVEGVPDTGRRKGSAGSSQELETAVGHSMSMEDGKSPLKVAAIAASTRDRSGSIGQNSLHTRKSSSVTSFAQSAHWEASTSPPQTTSRRRASNRSMNTNFLPQLNMNGGGNRRSMAAESAEDFIQMTPVSPGHEGGVYTWTGAGGGPPLRGAGVTHPPSRAGSVKRSNSLPPGAAVPALIASGRTDPAEQQQQNISRMVASATTKTGPTENSNASVATRRTSSSFLPRVVRKKAPQLPAGMEAPPIMASHQGNSSNPHLHYNSGPTSPASNFVPSPSSDLQPPHFAQPYSFLPHNASASSLGTTGTRFQNPNNPLGKRTSVDMLQGSGMSPNGDGAFDRFVGAKTDGVVLLMPDLPMDQR